MIEQITIERPAKQKPGRPSAKTAIYVGQKFERLTVVAVGRETDHHGHRFHSCVCSCRPGQKPREYREDFLRSGRVKSCGCLRAETQWNFGIKKRKPRRKSCGVGDSKPPQVPQPSVVIADSSPTVGSIETSGILNVARIDTPERHKAVAQFHVGIAKLVESGALPAESVPKLSYQELLALITEDTGPTFTSLPDCVQRLLLKVAKPVWNQILRDQGLTPTIGAHVKPNGNFTGIVDRDRTGRLETGYTEREMDNISEGQKRNGRRVRPTGHGPYQEEINDGSTDEVNEGEDYDDNSERAD